MLDHQSGNRFLKKLNAKNKLKLLMFDFELKMFEVVVK